MDKHFAPDVVIEAIKNSLATRNNDEIYAATVLAATQRPKNIRQKARITDATHRRFIRIDAVPKELGG